MEFTLKKQNKPKISIVIPTFNREDLIAETLHCLRGQTTSVGTEYEVIVVDNNSSDRTKRAVKSAIPLFSKKFRYLFEPKQGRAYALNVGILHAQGEIITCLDDDCAVNDKYVASIDEAFQKAGPEVGFIGGKILPFWMGNAIPAWLNEFLPGSREREKNRDGTNEFFCGPLGILDYGDKPFMIESNPQGEYPKLFYGANLSFRKSVFERFGYFLGDNALVEDTEMCQRLLNSGIKALYDPTIRVFHKIKASSVTPEYYYRWYFTRGMHREIVQTIDQAFCDESWVMFHRSFRKPMKAMMIDRCQALFNFGQMVKSWAPYDGEKP